MAAWKLAVCDAVAVIDQLSVENSDFQDEIEYLEEECRELLDEIKDLDEENQRLREELEAERARRTLGGVPPPITRTWVG